MNFAKFLAIVLLLAGFNAINAAELENPEMENDYVVYCSEQADREGIEDIDEKNQYVADCVESFEMSSRDDMAAE